MEENLLEITQQDFESIKHIDENGVEFWYARELMKVLNYSKWGNFIKVIDKAMEACKNSKMVQIGSTAEREQKDYTPEKM